MTPCPWRWKGCGGNILSTTTEDIAGKRGHWSLILMRLSRVVALIQLPAIIMEAGWTDSPALQCLSTAVQLPGQENWHYINTVPQHRGAGRKTTAVQNISNFGQVLLIERQTLRIKCTFVKNMYCDEGRRYFKSHLSLLTFNSMMDF